MIWYYRVTAIAVISSRALALVDTIPRAAAVAAVTLRWDGERYEAALHTHLPREPAGLHRWLDTLLADDPLLVAHRLARVSRLLRAAGYDRSLAGSFNREGRVDLRFRRTPRASLAVLAAAVGTAAVDEAALRRASAPIGACTLGTLALVNAAATAMLWAVGETERHNDDAPLVATLQALSGALARGPAPAAVRAVLPCTVQ